MASRYTTKNGRTARRGVFINGVWHCDCDPRLPAPKLQTKNGGKNHGRWCMFEGLADLSWLVLTDAVYTCQKPQVKRCDFFLWSDEAKVREESAVLHSARSEPQPLPQTPRKLATPATIPLTPETRSRPARDNDVASLHEEAIGQKDASTDDSFDWPSSADEDLVEFAESASKPLPLQFETPRKAQGTDLFSSPGKRRHSEIANNSAQSATLSNESDDIFETPSKSNRSHGLLSPDDTPSKGRSQVEEFTGPPEPASLATEVLDILKPVHLPHTIEAELIEHLNRKELRTQGIVKGREIARLAIQTKEKKIIELQERLAGMEGEKETSRAVIAHLKQDIATSPTKNWRGRGRGRGGGRKSLV